MKIPIINARSAPVWSTHSRKKVFRILIRDQIGPRLESEKRLHRVFELGRADDGNHDDGAWAKAGGTNSFANCTFRRVSAPRLLYDR